MKINLPTEVSAEDYHDFRYLCDNINEILKNDVDEKKPAVDFIETGVWNRDYHAYFYDVNNKPSNDDILMFYLKEFKGEYSNVEDLKEHFQSGWLNEVFLKNFDNVVKEVQKDENFFKSSKKKTAKP